MANILGLDKSVLSSNQVKRIYFGNFEFIGEGDKSTANNYFFVASSFRIISNSTGGTWGRGNHRTILKYWDNISNSWVELTRSESLYNKYSGYIRVNYKEGSNSYLTSDKILWSVTCFDIGAGWYYQSFTLDIDIRGQAFNPNYDSIIKNKQALIYPQVSNNVPTDTDCNYGVKIRGDTASLNPYNSALHGLFNYNSCKGNAFNDTPEFRVLPPCPSLH